MVKCNYGTTGSVDEIAKIFHYIYKENESQVQSQESNQNVKYWLKRRRMLVLGREQHIIYMLMRDTKAPV